jgi:hypothetical protein
VATSLSLGTIWGHPSSVPSRWTSLIHPLRGNDRGTERAGAHARLNPREPKGHLSNSANSEWQQLTPASVFFY